MQMQTMSRVLTSCQPVFQHRVTIKLVLVIPPIILQSFQAFFRNFKMAMLGSYTVSSEANAVSKANKRLFPQTTQKSDGRKLYVVDMFHQLV